MVKPVWVMCKLVPLPIIMSSLPWYSEWRDIFCKSEVTRWDAPECINHPVLEPFDCATKWALSWEEKEGGW